MYGLPSLYFIKDLVSAVQKLATQHITSMSISLTKKRRKNSRPGEIMEAALDLFVEKGFGATRLDELASRAGVSKGTIFLYFESKEDLFKAVVRENIVNHFSTWENELNIFNGSSSEMLNYAMNSIWERIGKTRASGITKLAISEAQNFPEMACFYLNEVLKPSHNFIRLVLLRGINRGDFREIDIDQIAQVVMASMIFLIMWKHSLGAYNSSANLINPEGFIKNQVSIILNGIKTELPTQR
jgi:TetR/AcrR family transcriptional regulator